MTHCLSHRPLMMNVLPFLLALFIGQKLGNHSLRKVGSYNQTFTCFRYACIVIPQITNYLTETCGYSYLLTSFLHTDPLEHHFGLYRMMSGSNYHFSYIQILESERLSKFRIFKKCFQTRQLPVLLL